MDKMVENLIKDCTTCELNNGGNRPEPIQSSQFPMDPWKEVSIDFFGPLPKNAELMTIIDSHSKFPIVTEVKSTSSIHVLPELDSIFSLMGIPETIKSDNGPPFNGIEFQKFCQHFNIQHKPIQPLWPQANGQVENFNKNLKKIIKNANNCNDDWKFELNAFLRNYRNTPHSTTTIPPASLIFINSNSSRLPQIKHKLTTQQSQLINIAKQNDYKNKINSKNYADKRRKAKYNTFEIGDKLLLNQLINKKI